MSKASRLVLVALAFCASACGRSSGTSDPGTDAGNDVAVDTPHDIVGPDAAPDMGEDAAEDTTQPDMPLDAVTQDNPEIPPEDVQQPDIPDVSPEETPPSDAPDVSPDDTPQADVLPETPDAELPQDSTADVPGEVVGKQPCGLDYDCEPGQTCKLGWCEPFEPDCKTEDDCPKGEKCMQGLCLEEGLSPNYGKLVFNEVLSDGSADGDANEDGSIDPMEDEFVEIVNVGNLAVDISGWTISETDWNVWLPRHTFADGTVIAPMGAVVVFGGGDAPESTKAVLFATSNAADPGTPFGLDLDDAGDEIRLLDSAGLTAAVFAYGDMGGVPAVSDQSITRSPDLTGAYGPHTLAAGSANSPFSPGTRVDGSPF